MYQSKKEKRKKMAAGLIAGVIVVGMVCTMVISALWGI